jgi:hypothetical protein
MQWITRSLKLSVSGTASKRKSHGEHLPSANYLAIAARLVTVIFWAGALMVGTASAQSWSQLAPNGALPKTRYAHCQIYNPKSGNMTIFGGFVGPGNPYANDVWVLSGANGLGTPSWAQLSAGGVGAPGSPVGRNSASCVYDSADNRMIIFGGEANFGGPSDVEQGDVWVLTNADGTGGPSQWIQLQPAGAIQPRAGHGAFYDPSSNRMIVYLGGTVANGKFVDVWALTNANGLGGTPTWIQLSTSGTPPAGRFLNAIDSSWDATENRVVMFGGTPGRPNDRATFNDTWVLTNASGLGGTPTWIQLSPQGALPLPRLGASGFYDSATKRLIVFGGTTDPGALPVLGDLWALSNADGNGMPVWQQISPTGTAIPGRSLQGSVYDSNQNRMTVFGGQLIASGAPVNETWVLTTANGISGTQLQINSITPNQGGNAGAATLNIVGAGFQTGMQVKLSGAGSSDIAGLRTNVVDTGLVTTTFDLRTAAAGSRDLIVTNPDNTSATLSAAFTVEAGGLAQVSGIIVGNSVVRVGSPATFVPVLANVGLINADLVFSYMTTGSVLGSQSGPAAQAQLGFTLLQGGFTSLSFQSQIALPPSFIIPPSSGCGTVQLFGGVVNSQTYTCDELAALINAAQGAQEAFQKSRLFNLELILTKIKDRKCYGLLPLSINENALCDALLSFDDAQDNTATANDNATKALCAAANNQGCPINCKLFDIDPFEVLASAINSAIHRLKTLSTLTGLDLTQVNVSITDASNSQSSTLPRAPCINCAIPQALSTPLSSITFCAVSSLDPNGKSGPVGSGQANYVSDAVPLPYTIRFENLPAATAPAQQVVIVDQLDPNFDWSTVSFYAMSFGSQFVNVAGAGSFRASLDLRPDRNVIVNLDAEVNVKTGLLTSHFTSIDPATGSPPTDPLNGFLPPDLTPPQGEGSIFFTAVPKKGVSTGTAITNVATIVFDANQPIQTPAWFNTVDNDPPKSQVAPLPATESSTRFTIRWTGTDVGAGIQDFTVYASDNAGPFAPFQANTTATSATFTGQAGHRYEFYSIARDLVGNVESTKTAAETTTQVGVDFSVFTAKVEITTGRRPSFEVKGSFALDSGSAAIAPESQPVTLALGTYSVTIPAGSFRKGEERSYEFEGKINGVRLEFQIASAGGNNYKFRVDGEGAILADAFNPVTVQLLIGGNGGTTQVTAEIRTRDREDEHDGRAEDNHK